MQMRRSRRAAGLALAVAVGLGGAALVRAGHDPGGTTYVVSAAAPPTDGPAYVHEAIENLRGAERFRFRQTVAGAGNATDPASGEVDGEVDLSSAAGDPPKYHSTVKLRTPAGEAVALEQIAIDEDLHVKGPKQDRFAKSDKSPKKAKGKKGGGTEEVDVVDPVMQLLEPVDTLPAGAFATPSAVDADGNRSVTVALPAGSLVLAVDDASRVVEKITFTHEGRTANFALVDFGVTDIAIEPPGG